MSMENAIAELQRQIRVEIETAENKVREEEGNWKEKWNILEKFVHRMVFDEKQRKAWMTAGEYQLLTEFMKSVEKKSLWHQPEQNMYDEHYKRCLKEMNE